MSLHPAWDKEKKEQISIWIAFVKTDTGRVVNMPYFQVFFSPLPDPVLMNSAVPTVL